MKSRYKFLILLILSMLALSSCSEKNTETVKVSELYETSQISKVSEPSEAPESSQDEISQDISMEISKEFSEDVSEEISEIIETSLEESSEAEISLTDESSESAYFFDDEQIVEDYHTAQTFTDDETFNESFMNNSIDKECSDKMKDAVTEADMRLIIGEYIEKWKEQSQSAYEKLKELLKDNPDELEKLEISQKNWTDTLDSKKEEWYSSENFAELGTMGLLSADTAMMNYYKGRAAVLYQQIFILTGNMEDI